LKGINYFDVHHVPADVLHAMQARIRARQISERSWRRLHLSVRSMLVREELLWYLFTQSDEYQNNNIDDDNNNKNRQRL